MGLISPDLLTDLVQTSLLAVSIPGLRRLGFKTLKFFKDRPPLFMKQHLFRRYPPLSKKPLTDLVKKSD